MAEKDQDNQANQDNSDRINVELDAEVAQGIYSNLAIITHSSSEFILDFIRMMPGLEKSSVKSRVILPPEHAKRLLKALQENIQKFESQYGEIKNTNTDAEGAQNIPMNFGGPTAEA